MEIPTQMQEERVTRSGGLEYKWIVAIVAVFGAFMSILDQTIVNIAIPRFQSAFGADLNSVQMGAHGIHFDTRRGDTNHSFLRGPPGYQAVLHNRSCDFYRWLGLVRACVEFAHTHHFSYSARYRGSISVSARYHLVVQ